MKNIFPKIVVIVAAIVLWFLIVSGQPYIGVIDIPLNIYEPRENMTLGQVLPKTVKVRIEGTGRALFFKGWTKKSSLILDVGAINDNQRISLKNYFKERPNQVRLQSGISFLEVVYPDSIDIMIDKKIQKKVPVHVNTDISVRSGYVQVNKPEPQTVLLTGPEAYLETIDMLQSDMLKRENADVSFFVDVPVKNPDPDLISMDPEYLTVDIGIEMIGERSIGNIPIQIRNQPDNLTLQFIPNTVVLRITGGNNQIQELTSRDFYVYFDYLSQWFPNKNFYRVNVISPEQVLDVIRMVPEQIEVVVIKKSD